MSVEVGKASLPEPPFKKAFEQKPPGLESKLEPRPDYGLESYKGFGRLQDKVAIVTGGDSGIGRAVCLAFAREGADVVCSYLNEHEDAQELKKAIDQTGRKCLLAPGDLSEEAQCKKLIHTCVKEFGRIDILVNNHATQLPAKNTFADIDHERIIYTFKTNIVSFFDLCRLALPHMEEGSSIINSGSIQAYEPSHSILDYATTKGAIVAFTKGLAQELTAKQIRVNCVAPGPVWTPLIVSSFSKEKIQQFASKYPKGRPAQPVELAPSYVFLASSESLYISGEVLGVTGGVPLA